MQWQLEPPESVQRELERMGSGEAKGLLKQTMEWIEQGETDDLAIARGIIDRGRSEELAWWLIKEARMRELDHRDSHSPGRV